MSVSGAPATRGRNRSFGRSGAARCRRKPAPAPGHHEQERAAAQVSVRRDGRTGTTLYSLAGARSSFRRISRHPDRVTRTPRLGRMAASAMQPPRLKPAPRIAGRVPGGHCWRTSRSLDSQPAQLRWRSTTRPPSGCQRPCACVRPGKDEIWLEHVVQDAFVALFLSPPVWAGSPTQPPHRLAVPGYAQPVALSSASGNAERRPTF